MWGYSLLCFGRPRLVFNVNSACLPFLEAVNIIRGGIELGLVLVCVGIWLRFDGCSPGLRQGRKNVTVNSVLKSTALYSSIYFCFVVGEVLGRFSFLSAHRRVSGAAGCIHVGAIHSWQRPSLPLHPYNVGPDRCAICFAGSGCYTTTMKGGW